MTGVDPKAELAECQRLLVLAYDDDCGLMAWEGSEDVLLRAFEAKGQDEEYWIAHLKDKLWKRENG